MVPSNGLRSLVRLSVSETFSAHICLSTSSLRLLLKSLERSGLLALAQLSFSFDYRTIDASKLLLNVHGNANVETRRERKRPRCACVCSALHSMLMTAIRHRKRDCWETDGRTSNNTWDFVFCFSCWRLGCVCVASNAGTFELKLQLNRRFECEFQF